DYLWRWDTDWFWCSRAFGAQNPKVRRWWPKRLLRSSFYWKLIAYDHRWNIGDKLTARKGLPPIVPAEGLEALDRLLAAGARGHAGLIPFVAELWCQFYPSLSLWSELAAAGESAEAARGGASLRERLAAMASPAKRWSELLGHVLAQVAQVLGLAPEKIDPDAPLASLGMESLQTTELRNSLQVSLGVSLPSTLIWRYPTAAAIAGHLAEQLGFAAPSAAVEEAPAPAPVEEGASDDELAQLLSQEVAALNQMTE
ncbi:MAG TPA: acyl carrier protein, partial [Thermoanaerobaculia bacterium]|nr:acyl carrier protein [Thermoanaerobaculia bacterium]